MVLQYKHNLYTSLADRLYYKYIMLQKNSLETWKNSWKELWTI